MLCSNTAVYKLNRVLPWPPAQQNLPYNNYANKNQLKWNPQ